MRHDINVQGWFVYTHALLRDTLSEEEEKAYYTTFYVGVGYAHTDKIPANLAPREGNGYEYRRYTNRPKDWTQLVKNHNNKFMASIFIHNILNEKLAKSIQLALIYFLNKEENKFIIQQTVAQNDAADKVLMQNNSGVKVGMRDYICQLYHGHRAEFGDHANSVVINVTKRNYNPRVTSRAIHDAR